MTRTGLGAGPSENIFCLTFKNWIFYDLIFLFNGSKILMKSSKQKQKNYTISWLQGLMSCVQKGNLLASFQPHKYYWQKTSFVEINNPVLNVYIIHHTMMQLSQLVVILCINLINKKKSLTNNSFVSYGQPFCLSRIKWKYFLKATITTEYEDWTFQSLCNLVKMLFNIKVSLNI